MDAPVVRTVQVPPPPGELLGDLGYFAHYHAITSTELHAVVMRQAIAEIHKLRRLLGALDERHDDDTAAGLHDGTDADGRESDGDPDVDHGNPDSGDAAADDPADGGQREVHERPVAEA